MPLEGLRGRLERHGRFHPWGKEGLLGRGRRKGFPGCQKYIKKTGDDNVGESKASILG